MALNLTFNSSWAKIHLHHMETILTLAQNPAWLSFPCLCLGQTDLGLLVLGQAPAPEWGGGRPKSELTLNPPGAPPEQVCLLLQPPPPGEYPALRPAGQAPTGSEPLPSHLVEGLAGLVSLRIVFPRRSLEFPVGSRSPLPCSSCFPVSAGIQGAQG